MSPSTDSCRQCQSGPGEGQGLPGEAALCWAWKEGTEEGIAAEETVGLLLWAEWVQLGEAGQPTDLEDWLQYATHSPPPLSLSLSFPFLCLSISFI